MKRTEIAKLYAAPGQYTAAPVTIGGWIRTNRDSKALGFMEVNDGSCFKGVQVVFEREKVADYAAVAKLNVGTAVIVTGNLILTPDARCGPTFRKVARTEVLPPSPRGPMCS